MLSSPDAHAFAHYANVPTVAGQSNSLSQLSFADAGALMIERFGFGTASAVFSITGADTIAALTGPDPTRRRLGLISIGSNRLLSTWFIKSGSNPPQGALSLITYDPNAHTAVERDLLTGLGKPVGIAVSGDNVYVSDQANNDIVKASLSALLASSQAVAASGAFVQINSPDLMTVDARGTLYTKCNTTGPVPDRAGRHDRRACKRLSGRPRRRRRRAARPAVRDRPRDRQRWHELRTHFSAELTSRRMAQSVQ
ncbi:hypothetical protein [Paraburkholderia bryophila]|uniref:Uncharacterized protein n=1 Tax=Paraburkholderia bryophila TaxID=420952 RepID=A0A7Z0B0D1_9BURK|nr:hypothetical protein [Paraburkholderia bryophila]NYH16641.1 hypothetical protein [Paraburkholderia bryophila]